MNEGIDEQNLWTQELEYILIVISDNAKCMGRPTSLLYNP